MTSTNRRNLRKVAASLGPTGIVPTVADRITPAEALGIPRHVRDDCHSTAGPKRSPTPQHSRVTLTAGYVAISTGGLKRSVRARARGV